MQKRVEVTIAGISSLLMHAYPLVPIEAIEKKTPEEQAEFSAYRDPITKELYIPGVCIQRGLINGATYSKGKGRASLQKQTAACVLVDPERVSLGVSDYSIDTRPVVVPATRGRVLRHRPRLDSWEVTFSIEWDGDMLKESELSTIVDNTGSRVGLLDFRPERKGPFGRFVVNKWKTK